MFVTLWEYEVKPGKQVAFEKAYGPEGAWVQLFKCDVHFRGTQLLADSSRPLYYFTVDFWDSESAYKGFLEANREQYKELDNAFKDLTQRERHIVAFQVDPLFLAGPNNSGCG